jgi:hypothetical protein
MEEVAEEKAEPSAVEFVCEIERAGFSLNT